MPLLNKEKMMDGFGKAVDAVNNAADKAGKYAKEKELDKKIDHAAEVVTKEAKKVGKEIKSAYQIIAQIFMTFHRKKQPKGCF